MDFKVFNKILFSVKERLESPCDRNKKLSEICLLLKEEMPCYDWVGFYLMDKNKRELLLGPFAGESTVHVKIPLGRGICGMAAATGKTMVIQDVSSQQNYLSCSPKVKSEIVVPIFKDSEVVGELDIDSHRLNCFGPQDKQLLNEIGKMVAEIF